MENVWSWLNFINVLRTAFALVDPESVKRHGWLNCIFYAFGIYKCKRTLMKLTPYDVQKRVLFKFARWFSYVLKPSSAVKSNMQTDFAYELPILIKKFHISLLFLSISHSFSLSLTHTQTHTNTNSPGEIPYLPFLADILLSLLILALLWRFKLYAPPFQNLFRNIFKKCCNLVKLLFFNVQFGFQSVSSRKKFWVEGIFKFWNWKCFLC